MKSNEELKDRHVGSRCFVLGAGSSVKEQDIGKLEGEFVISVSNTFVHQEFPRIKPRYHTLPPLLRGHGGLHSEKKFVGWLQEMEIATGGAEMVMHIGDRGMVERNSLFKGRPIHWVEYMRERPESFDGPIDLASLPPIWSVSELAITIAVYLGFEKIYLVGIDHDWFNGALVYFYDHTKEHALRPNETDLSFVDSEFQMRRHAYIFKKYKYLFSMKGNIYNANANPRHYLDVFPKVDYDTLF
ncbi:MAG: hypothetical protein OEY86_02180 [Nitrospira sp.]|nr:hypothetical protein [Nitrospira sp.]